MILIANAAYCNIGYIDWEPHLPLMFTRFLRSFNLPVFYKQIPNNKQHNIGKYNRIDSFIILSKNMYTF